MAPRTSTATQREPTVEELRAENERLMNEANAIQAQAQQEKRKKTQEEQQTFNALLSQVETNQGLLAEMEDAARLQNMTSTLGQARLPVPPEPIPVASQRQLAQPVQASVPARRITGGLRNGCPQGQNDFAHFGEFTKTVRIAATTGQIDRRLLIVNAADGQSEAVDAEGGYIVPPDFRTQVVETVYAEDNLLGMTDMIPTVSNAITFPLDSTTPWGTAGVTMAWLGEAADGSVTKGAVGQLTVKLQKIAAFVQTTSELQEDAPASSAWLQSRVAKGFVSALNEAYVAGTGDSNGQPEGLLSSPSKIAVAKETGQANNSVVLANIQKMWSRMYAPFRAPSQNCCWIINQDVEPALQGLKIEGSAGGVFPVYIPPGGVSGAPYATLYGRPIFYSESCSELGTEGDIILCACKQYLTVTKSPGMRQDVSIHVKFMSDQTTYRFLLRTGGASWVRTPITRRHGSNTLTNVVTLANRVAGP